jgi:hypothetical protein
MGMQLKGKLIWKTISKTYQRENEDGSPPEYAVRNNGYYVRGECDTYLVSPPNRLIMILEDEESGKEYSIDIMPYIRDYKLEHYGLKFRMTKNAREMFEKMIKERLTDGRIYVKEISQKDGCYYIYGMYELVETFFNER